MKTKREIQSKENILNARLKQIKNSPLFSDAEKKPLIAKIEKELDNLANQMDVIDSETITE